MHSFSDSVFVANDGFPISSSFVLAIDSTFILRPNTDYFFDTAANKFILSRSLRELLFSNRDSVGRSYILSISYHSLPFVLKKEFRLNALLGDSTKLSVKSTENAVHKIQTTSPPPSDLVFHRRGGITRGIQFGSTQEATFQNNFNLTFSGEIDNDVKFSGALSEESAPIQPEGNTVLLRELDRIYITIEKPNLFRSTLGDFVASNKRMNTHDSNKLIPTFGAYSRKVLGGTAEVTFDKTSFNATASASRGIFHSNIFQGQESFQGPYRLTGENGERTIIIIAGSEKVYVDGVLQSRGDNHDYIIDYGLAEIHFQPHTIITSASRITVDFEYSTENYSRSLLAGDVSTSIFSNAFHLSTYYFREGDDQDAPRNITLSDADKQILLNAGSDPAKASRSGVVLVGKDSNGRAKGSYIAIDSSNRFYRYAPLDTVSAMYNIAFGFAGSSKGQYIRRTSLEYVYVGIGNGDYDTTIYLPLPQLHQVFGGILAVNPFKQFQLIGEYAISNLNVNRFAPNASFNDAAYKVNASYKNNLFLDSTTNFILLDGFVKKKNKYFLSVEKDNPTEYLRKYGIESHNTDITFIFDRDEDEKKVNAAIGIGRFSLLSSIGSYRSDLISYKASNYSASLAMKEDSLLLPTVRLNYEYIPTSFLSSRLSSMWNTFTADASKTFWSSVYSLRPFITYTKETRRSLFETSPDSITSESFRRERYDIGAYLSLAKIGSLSINTRFGVEDSVLRGKFLRVNNNQTYTLTSHLNPLSGFGADLDLGYRKKQYTDSAFKLKAGGDQDGVFIRFSPQFRSIDGFASAEAIYQVTKDRSAKLERVFLPVQKGTGNYRYIGDLNGNGKQDANEFEIAHYNDQGNYILINFPTETLQPTTDLRSSLRLRLRPASLLGTSTTTFAQLFGSISTESYLHFDERSLTQSASDVYLYHLSTFQSDSLTLQGTIEYQQDISILDNDPNKQFRIRFSERRSANQFNTGLERLYNRLWSLRMRLNPSYEFSTETNVEYIFDKAVSNILSSTQPHNTERIRASTELTFNPITSSFTMGLRGGYGISTERSLDPNIRAATTQITFLADYSPSSTAKLHAEFGGEDLHLLDPSISLPYSLTEGREPDLTLRWGASFEYRLASGIIAGVHYDGRKNTSPLTHSDVIHNARAEVRATF